MKSKQTRGNDRSSFKRYGAAAFVAMAILALAGCPAPDDPSALPQKTGKGTVYINLGGGARTLLPSQIDLSRLHYVLVFTQTGGGGQHTETQTGQEPVVVQLDAGTWNLDIRGHVSQDGYDPSAAVAYYTENDITVSPGANVTVNAKLLLNQNNMTQDRTGTFSYDITIPQGATGTLTVLSLDGDLVGQPVALTQSVNRGDLELASGKYNISVVMVHEGTEKEWWVLAHIYDSAITKAVTGPDDFTDPAPEPEYGTITITLTMDDFTMTDEGYGVFDHVDLPVILNKSTGSSVTITASDLNVIAWRIGSTVIGTGSGITLNAAQFNIGSYTLSLTFTRDGKIWQSDLVFSVVYTATTPPGDGIYKIRSLAGNYLSYGGSVPNCSQQDGYNTWYLRAENGAYCFFKEYDNSYLLDVYQNWDNEGNKVQLVEYNGTSAQRWLIEPNSDGSYQIRTSNSSGRVITDKGAEQITIQTYTGNNTQKWTLEQVAELLPVDVDEGHYRIRSLAGKYLSFDTGDFPNCSTLDRNNAWYLKKAENGGYCFFKELDNTDLLDVYQGWDTEGNKIQLVGYNGTSAQRWLFVPNGDGSYRIRSSMNSGRVITDNSAQQITIQMYGNLDTQKWTLERLSGEEARTVEEEARFRKYRQIVRSVNENAFDFDDIVVHTAEGKTDAELKALLAANYSKENMIEGEYIALHFPSSVWAQYEDPKALIDAYDFIYKAAIDLMGRTKPIHNGRMVFCTDYDAVYYGYSVGEYCAFSEGAAENEVKDWVNMKYPGWAVGHEIGHTMGGGVGDLFYTPYDGESWVNIFNIYAYYKAGHYDYARNFSSGQTYDLLNDEDRKVELLAADTAIFVKFPLLLIDNYGWDGMRAFMTKAARDHDSGVQKSEALQGRIDYLAVNMSIAYQMDISDLLDYWRLSPSASAKAQIAHLPKEQTIAASYGIQY